MRSTRATAKRDPTSKTWSLMSPEERLAWFARRTACPSQEDIEFIRLDESTLVDLACCGFGSEASGSRDLHACKFCSKLSRPEDYRSHFWPQLAGTNVCPGWRSLGNAAMLSKFTEFESDFCPPNDTYGTVPRTTIRNPPPSASSFFSSRTSDQFLIRPTPD